MPYHVDAYTQESQSMHNLLSRDLVHNLYFCVLFLKVMKSTETVCSCHGWKNLGFFGKRL